MISIKYKFNERQRKNPAKSSYLNFSEMVQDKDFNRDMVRRWFNKLVDEDDYSPDIKRTVLRRLYEITKPPEDYHIRQ